MQITCGVVLLFLNYKFVSPGLIGLKIKPSNNVENVEDKMIHVISKRTPDDIYSGQFVGEEDFGDYNLGLSDFEEDDLRKSEADPTHHKHKVHTHVYSHFSTHGHGHFHNIPPLISPVHGAGLLYPSGNHQGGFQIQNDHSSANWGPSSAGGYGVHSPGILHGTMPQKTQFISNQQIHQNTQLVNNQNQHVINNNQELIAGGVSGQTGYADRGFQNNVNNIISNQQIQQNTQLVNNQNQNIISNNQHLISGGVSEQTGFAGTGFQNNVNNMQISQINGNNNAVSQSQTGNGFIPSQTSHIFSQRKTHPILVDEDIRRVAPSDYNNEPPPCRVDWYPNPQQPTPQMEGPVSEVETQPQYDTDMDNILNVLDERSYYQVRPEVTTTPRYEKKYVPQGKHIVKICDCICNQVNDPNEDYNKKDERKNLSDSRNSSSDAEVLQSPYLVQIPYNDYTNSYGWQRGTERNKRSSDNKNVTTSSTPFKWTLKNLNDTFTNYKNMINSYRANIKQKEELIFTDILGSMVDDFQERELLNFNNIEKITNKGKKLLDIRGEEESISSATKRIIKRTAPIKKLFVDPNVQLDVPKTLENLGTIAKNSFENEKSPMYHMRNLMGSTKNAVLSAMRIPPQNFIIPSNYQIQNIQPEEITSNPDQIVGSINQKILSRSSFSDDDADQNSIEQNGIPKDPYGIVETFTRVGSAIRDSVRSGQNTLNHIGEIAHNGKKIYHSMKTSVPRFIIPSLKNQPIVLRNRFKETKLPRISQTVVITPRIVDIKNPALGSKPDTDYVKMGDMLVALGISKADRNHLDLDKFYIKTPENNKIKGIYIPPNGKVASVNGKKIVDNIKEKFSTNNEDESVMLPYKQRSKNNPKKIGSSLPNSVQEIMTRSKYNIDILRSGKTSNKKLYGRKHFTEKEEDEIIDKFLLNIFKKDHQNDSEIEFILSEIENQNTDNNTKNRIKTKEKVKSISKNLSRLNNNDNIQELLRELTTDILRKEGKLSKECKSFYANTDRKKITKTNARNHRIGKGLSMRSRFVDDNDHSASFSSPSVTFVDSLRTDRIETVDDKTSQKIDDYVLNDIASSKIGDVHQITDEQPEEDTPAPKDEDKNNDTEHNSTGFSSRNLLWVADEQNSEEERVGLNLPMELMKPFMARVPDSEIKQIFNSEENGGENLKEKIIDSDNSDKGGGKDEELSGSIVMMPNNPSLEENKNGLATKVATEKPIANGASFLEKSAGSQDVKNNLNQHNCYSYSPSENMKRIMFKFDNNRFENHLSQDEISSHGFNINSEKSHRLNGYDDRFTSDNLANSCKDGECFEEKILEAVPENDGIGQARTSMVVIENLRKPFMGMASNDAMREFFTEFNGDGTDSLLDNEQESLLTDSE